jgi:hypothetical protein
MVVTILLCRSLSKLLKKRCNEYFLALSLFNSVGKRCPSPIPVPETGPRVTNKWGRREYLSRMNYISQSYSSLF